MGWLCSLFNHKQVSHFLRVVILCHFIVINRHSKPINPLSICTIIQSFLNPMVSLCSYVLSTAISPLSLVEYRLGLLSRLFLFSPNSNHLQLVRPFHQLRGFSLHLAVGSFSLDASSHPLGRCLVLFSPLFSTALILSIPT